jgi:DNA-binding NarL/FixJ family response regulator
MARAANSKRTTSVITVLVADDHPFFRHGLVSVLSDCPEIEVVAEAENTQEVIAKAAETQPSVIVMDLSMPGGGGIEATAAVKKALPGCKVLILTASESDDDMLMAMKAGANGYLLKYVDVDELVAAVKTIAMGELIIYPSMATKLVNHIGRTEQPVPDPVDVLSVREMEVLKLVAGGSRNAEIASQLNITEATVKAHLRNIMDKLEVKNRAQAVAKAHHIGLLKDWPASR